MEDSSFSYYNTSSNDGDSDTDETSNIVVWIIIGTGLSLNLVAIFVVSSKVKSDQVAPVSIVNLLISHLIQYCSTIPLMLHFHAVTVVFDFGFTASVAFMVCVSIERYLAVAKPLWYRFRQNIKTSVMVSVMVWMFSLVFTLASFSSGDQQTNKTTLAVFLLLPFPLFIFFLAGTVKALSEARSVPADEKRRIIAILVMVLLIYAVLFLPIIISLLLPRRSPVFKKMVLICAVLSPLADAAMFVLLRKSVVDKLLALLCCCKTLKNQEINGADKDNPTAVSTETV
ncbi:G-protein coupled receptor 4-like [Cyprinodon tularosa]|uniref:G-protein coupled receptor 4-like n=1 Tax=Cyprinodon tularosa TaxID=77115 RepID=UPI0018E1E3C0|nr:G-protein coupled receptor 4-like [Cyprinodon tularosa]